jgi:hypothetical protein
MKFLNGDNTILRKNLCIFAYQNSLIMGFSNILLCMHNILKIFFNFVDRK